MVTKERNEIRLKLHFLCIRRQSLVYVVAFITVVKSSSDYKSKQKMKNFFSKKSKKFSRKFILADGPENYFFTGI